MAGIIKAGRTTGNSHSISGEVFNFDDVTEKAQRYLQQVQQQATQLLQDVRRQAEQIRQQAEEQGRLAARQQAEEAARAEVARNWQTIVPALEQAVASLEGSKEAWLQQWQQNVLRLALAIARRVVRREVQQTPEITLELLREALELAAGSTQLKVHMHPQDLQTLGEHVQELAAQFGRLAPSDIVPDPKVAPGGCLVTTQYGSIDQQLESQLARIEQELL